MAGTTPPEIALLSGPPRNRARSSDCARPTGSRRSSRPAPPRETEDAPAPAPCAARRSARPQSCSHRAGDHLVHVRLSPDGDARTLDREDSVAIVSSAANIDLEACLTRPRGNSRRSERKMEATSTSDSVARQMDSRLRGDDDRLRRVAVRRRSRRAAATGKVRIRNGIQSMTQRTLRSARWFAPDRSGLRPSRGSNGATAGCSRSTPAKRTRGATSTSSRPASGHRSGSPTSTDGAGKGRRGTAGPALCEPNSTAWKRRRVQASMAARHAGSRKGPAQPVHRVRASVQPRDRHLREVRGCLVDSTGGILQTPPPESGVQGKLFEAPG